MVTVKRQKKRSLHSPAARYKIGACAVVFIAVLALCAFGLSERFRLQTQIEDLTDYMAKSIRTDLNQALQSYNAMDRRSADLSGDILPNMKRYMYSAYSMNRLLVEARGESYSMLYTATYNNFQTIVGEFERLLANGQSTTSVKTSLGDYMQAIETTLSSRFDSADLLLPQTARK